MIKLERILLLLIIILAFTVRLYKIDNPLADWHSWRQVDTSSVSRNFITNGFDILHPKFDDLSNIASGIDNPNGYRFVEFPLFNISQAVLYKSFNYFSLEESGRIISLISSLFAVIFIYFIVKRHSDVTVALFSSFFYALLPFSIYYGRAVLPDQSMISAILGGILFFDLWLDKNERSKIKDKKSNKWNIFYSIYYILALIFISAALLLKPYALFFVLPMLYLAWKRYKLKMFLEWRLWLFLIITIIPLILWRTWMTQYPEGIPVNEWLLNAGNIRFKGAFFYWLFAERIGKLILGYWGVVIFAIGVLINSEAEHLKKGGFFFYSFLLSSLLYLTVFARGNVQHDYYQILIVPSIAIFLGLGAKALFFTQPNYINPILSKAFLLIIIIFSLSFSWYYVRDYFNINNSAIIKTGEAVDKLTPKNAKIIAPYNGDTTLLYYTKRKGWPSFEKSIPELVKMGANYLVLINPTKEDYNFTNTYKLIAKDNDYLIFNLKP